MLFNGPFPALGIVTHIESLQTQIKKCEAQLVCELCGYEASSTTVLKSHVTRIHKMEVLFFTSQIINVILYLLYNYKPLLLYYSTR